MQGCDVDLRLFAPRLIVEHVRDTVQKLILPLLDLVWMQVELLRQLAHRSVALRCGQCDLCLEGRVVVPSRSSCHLRSFVPAKLPNWERKIHL